MKGEGMESKSRTGAAGGLAMMSCPARKAVPPGSDCKTAEKLPVSFQPVSHDLVKEHGGDIQAANLEPCGARVTLELPVHADFAAAMS